MEGCENRMRGKPERRAIPCVIPASIWNPKRNSTVNFLVFSDFLMLRARRTRSVKASAGRVKLRGRQRKMLSRFGDRYSRCQEKEGGGTMKRLHCVAFVLLVIGGLNWLLVGLFNWDLIAAIFGEMSWLSRLIYIIVGLSAILAIFGHKAKCKACDTGTTAGGSASKPQM